MFIKELILQNFRGFEEIKIPLHRSFNLIIGDNGSGKTAILEALTVAMGSLFLGIRGQDSKNILAKDIHIKTLENSEEFGLPVYVSASGTVKGKEIIWERELSSVKGKTHTKGAASIKTIGKEYDSLLRNGEKINLPVLVYYATGRLFEEARYTQKEKSKIPEIASRLRAYEQCLQAKMTFNKFIEWYKGKELAIIQKGMEDVNYSVVKNAIINNIPDCENVYYEFDPDKPTGLKIVLKDGRTLPFSYLSDGTRNFFALIADIAFKCITLNPHLKEKALEESPGMVLIDELDLHLHPEWQRKIIFSLKNTFPKIQFITTTHSLFLIQETETNQLIKLKNNQIASIGQGNNLSIEDIAEEFQEVKNPQWSKTRQHMYQTASKYYQAVKEGTDSPEMKEEFDQAMKPFAHDTAFYAIIEREKIKADYKRSLRNNEARK